MKADSGQCGCCTAAPSPELSLNAATALMQFVGIYQSPPGALPYLSVLGICVVWAGMPPIPRRGRRSCCPDLRGGWPVRGRLPLMLGHVPGSGRCRPVVGLGCTLVGSGRPRRSPWPGHHLGGGVPVKRPSSPDQVREGPSRSWSACWVCGSASPGWRPRLRYCQVHPPAAAPASGPTM
jgi:hypothetical protein